MYFYLLEFELVVKTTVRVFEDCMPVQMQFEALFLLSALDGHNLPLGAVVLGAGALW